MRGMRTTTGLAASGLATDAGVRALSEGDLQGRPADIVPREGDVPSLALALRIARVFGRPVEEIFRLEEA